MRYDDKDYIKLGLLYEEIITPTISDKVNTSQPVVKEDNFPQTFSDYYKRFSVDINKSLSNEAQKTISDLLTHGQGTFKNIDFKLLQYAKTNSRLIVYDTITKKVLAKFMQNGLGQMVSSIIGVLHKAEKGDKNLSPSTYDY